MTGISMSMRNARFPLLGLCTPRLVKEHPVDLAVDPIVDYSLSSTIMRLPAPPPLSICYSPLEEPGSSAYCFLLHATSTIPPSMETPKM